MKNLLWGIFFFLLSADLPAATEFGISDGRWIYRGSPRLTATEISKLGATCIYLETKWSSYEPRQGQYDFRDLTARIQECKKMELQPCIRLKTGINAWATVAQDRATSPGVGMVTSLMPRRMADWTAYVAEVVKVCRPMGVVRYAILNEAEAADHFQGTPQQYHELLQASYHAIKTADSQAIVLDHGFTSLGLGYAYAGWLLDQKQDAKAVQFIQNYLRDYYGPPVTGIEDLRQRYNKSAWARGGYEYLVKGDYFRLNRDCFDELQLHLYDDYSESLEAVQWLRERMREAGAEKPFAVWEAGTHMRKDSWNEQAQALRSIKKCIMLAGEGATQVMYLLSAEPTADYLKTDPLFARRALSVEPLCVWMSNEWKMTPTGEAFAVMTAQCKDATAIQRVDLPGAVMCYEIKSPQAKRWILWDDSPKPAALALPDVLHTKQIACRDLYGKALTVIPREIKGLMYAEELQHD